jgi:hypothetical protein
MEKYAKINDLSSTITLSSGFKAKIGNLGLMDNIEDTYMWVHMVEACPKMLVQLYHGPIQIFFHLTASLAREGAGGWTGAETHVHALRQFGAAIQIPSTFLTVRSRTNYKNAYFWV